LLQRGRAPKSAEILLAQDQADIDTFMLQRGRAPKSAEMTVNGAAAPIASGGVNFTKNGRFENHRAIS